MLGAHLVLLAVVYVNLVHLIVIGQRAARDVYMVFGAVLQVEHDTVTGVAYNAIDLCRKKNDCCVKRTRGKGGKA